jgi:hypothetical protein
MADDDGPPRVTGSSSKRAIGHVDGGERSAVQLRSCLTEDMAGLAAITSPKRQRTPPAAAAASRPPWPEAPSSSDAPRDGVGDDLVQHATLHKAVASDTLGVHFFTDFDRDYYFKRDDKLGTADLARGLVVGPLGEPPPARSSAGSRSCGLVKYVDGRAAGMLPRGARVVTVNGHEVR